MLFLRISAATFDQTNGTIEHRYQSGSSLSAPLKRGSEEFSTTKRSLLRGMIAGLKDLEVPRSAGRPDVNVVVETVGFARELCHRETAGRPDDPDHDLWGEYLHLKTKFNLNFLQSGQSALRSLA